MAKKIDIGLIWAKYLAIWSQIAVVAGTVQNIMTMGIFYFTVIKYVTDFPLWLYILIIVVGIITVITFIMKIGISGHYRFFSDQSRITGMEKEIADIKLSQKNTEKSQQETANQLLLMREVQEKILKELKK